MGKTLTNHELSQHTPKNDEGLPPLEIEMKVPWPVLQNILIDMAARELVRPESARDYSKTKDNGLRVTYGLKTGEAVLEFDWAIVCRNVCTFLTDEYPSVSDAQAVDMVNRKDNTLSVFFQVARRSI